MRTAEWRVSTVPELRSILLVEKSKTPARILRIAESQKHPLVSALARNDAVDRLRIERSLLRSLESTDMYWVAADMVGLALDAAGDVPGFDPAIDLPAPDGFMVLEQPLPGIGTWVRNEHGEQVDTQLGAEVIFWATVGPRIVIESYCRSAGLPNPGARPTAPRVS